MPPRKRPLSLDAALARKAGDEADEAPPGEGGEGKTVTLTLRLPPIVHDQIREMAYAERRSQHSLLLEALNLLFERHGKPPIAS